MNVKLLAIALAATACTAVGQAPAGTATVAFTNVSVIPMDSERVLAGQTVVVRGDRIVAVGPAGSVRVPAGATRIDGTGQFLLPGLAEMHGHVPPPSAPAAAVENTLFLYLAGGITTVRGMLGAPGQLQLRERVRSGQALGPTLYLAGPSFNGNSVNSPADAERMVRQQKLEGWDLLKVHPGLSRDEYDAMARTARDVGIRFGGHVPADVGLLHAIEMGQETFDHMDGYIELLRGDGPMDPAAVSDIVRRTRAANAWVVPTSALWETLLGVTPLATLTAMPELKYMPPQTVRSWTAAHENRLRNPQPPPDAARTIAQNRVALLRALHEGGAQILMGTDAPQQFSVPGFSIHHELRKMAESGMTPYEILVTGTRNVGRYFAGSDRFGIIAPGNRADMLLLRANPLENLANLTRRSGVMVRGRWLPESEIEAGLARIAASNSGG